MKQRKLDVKLPPISRHHNGGPGGHFFSVHHADIIKLKAYSGMVFDVPLNITFSFLNITCFNIEVKHCKGLQNF